MVRRGVQCGMAVAAAVLLLGVAQARAGFILVEDWEDVALGSNLANANAGESFLMGNQSAQSPSATVVASPWDALNRAAKVTNPGAGLYTSLTIPNGSTATLFYQIYRDTGRVNLSSGMSDVANPAYNFANFESQVNVNALTGPQYFRVRDGGSFVNFTSSFDGGALYNIWHVIDNSDAANLQGDDTTRLYIQQVGVDAAPVLMVSGTKTDFGFRNGAAANNLVTFLFMTGAGNTTDAAHTTAYLDNIYLDTSGANLDRPPGVAPEPATLALMGLGLAGLAMRRRR